jgi:hypothetical protein
LCVEAIASAALIVRQVADIDYVRLRASRKIALVAQTFEPVVSALIVEPVVYLDEVLLRMR